MDIATGTGFLAGHLSKYYSTVIGTDISDAQLLAASERYKSLENVSFKNCNIENLSHFLDKENLKGKVDLFTMG
jgi:ubiquinone/menaquinone biosynthesis C-methylase UbiE